MSSIVTDCQTAAGVLLAGVSLEVAQNAVFYGEPHCSSELVCASCCFTSLYKPEVKEHEAPVVYIMGKVAGTLLKCGRLEAFLSILSSPFKTGSDALGVRIAASLIIYRLVKVL